MQFESDGQTWAVWLHAVRKSAAAAQQAKEDLRKERGEGLHPRTLELAEYVVVLTPLSPQVVPALQVLTLYRGRWQIELVFKRLKSLLGVGELAKYDPDSAKAWLQAKLLTALLMERLERESILFPPGDIRCWERSRWREFREVRDSFLQAVAPALHLEQLLKLGPRMGRNLRERQRKRVGQMGHLVELMNSVSN